MEKLLKSKWWLFLVVAILSVAAGIYLIAYPETSLETLIQFLGIIVGVTGLIMMIAFYRALKGQASIFWFSEGVVNVLLGMFLILFPSVFVKMVFIFFGIWIVLLGLIFMIIYFQLARSVYMLLTGIISLIAGFAIIFNPMDVAALGVRILGIVLLVSGILGILSSFNMRKFIPVEIEIK